MTIQIKRKDSSIKPNLLHEVTSAVFVNTTDTFYVHEIISLPIFVLQQYCQFLRWSESVEAINSIFGTEKESFAQIGSVGPRSTTVTTTTITPTAEMVPGFCFVYA